MTQELNERGVEAGAVALVNLIRTGRGLEPLVDISFLPKVDADIYKMEATACIEAYLKDAK